MEAEGRALDGTETVQSDPYWSPDGQYLVGRKHFTELRSLGAGEMWLYDLNAGGSGVQLTERPTDQKDVNEPELSPDGRYLYYSLDSTPGQRFEYNKDPNGQIYVIDRLDREIRAYSDRCYFEVIYVQGAKFLDNLRRDYGNARFMAAIRAYTRDNRHDISNNARLLEALDCRGEIPQLEVV